MFRITKLALAVTSIMVYAAPAFAHPGHGRPESPIHGFLHPSSDLDHLLAALSVVIVAAAVIVAGGALRWRGLERTRLARRAD